MSFYQATSLLKTLSPNRIQLRAGGLFTVGTQLIPSVITISYLKFLILSFILFSVDKCGLNLFSHFCTKCRSEKLMNAIAFIWGLFVYSWSTINSIGISFFAFLFDFFFHCTAIKQNENIFFINEMAFNGHSGSVRL